MSADVMHDRKLGSAMQIKSLRDATILIKGGTGSFGNRVAAHLLRYRPGEIRIFSRDEKKQWENHKETV